MGGGCPSILFLDTLAWGQGTVPIHCRSIDLRSFTSINGFPLIALPPFPENDDEPQKRAAP